MTPYDLANRIADYVATHENFDAMPKMQVAREAAMVMLTDPGAVADVLRVLPAGQILLEFAARSPTADDDYGTYCTLCDAWESYRYQGGKREMLRSRHPAPLTVPEGHDPDCPWRQAVEWVRS